jgi:hypothetical protein
MKIYSKLAFVLLLVVNTAWAKEIPADQAALVGKNFIHQHFTNDSLAPQVPADLFLTYTRTSQSTDLAQAGTINTYYIFEFTGEEGFIIISADDRTYPVLGFSTQSGFDPQRINPALRKWLDSYHNQIIQVVVEDIPATAEIMQTWQALESGNPLKSLESNNSVGPLVSTRWDQSPYFNAMCPYDSYYGERTVSGCVATAVAQIMKYWNYPNQGTGFHTYQHDEFGSQSANFGGTNYQWSQMPNRVSSANNAVATLLYHVGVAVEMDYGVKGSSAATFEYEPGQHSGEYALKNYFGYKETLRHASREDYTDEGWSQLLRKELDEGRPLLYRGSGSGGGHAFVCDGYSSNTYFHFNWGWGGYQDGYFHMSALNPGGVGTGGGTGGFNSWHMAGIGVEPPQNTSTYDLKLFDHLTATPNPLVYGNEFTAHFDVANYGQNQFAGDYAVALFDEDVNFVDFVEVLTGWTLDGNYHYTDGITFTNSGSLTYLPGTYTLAAFYRPTGDNWKLIGNNEDYSNLTEFKIEHANDIEVYSAITLTPGPDIVQGNSFNVHLDIANTGDTDFTGTVDVSLYDLEGNFVETISEMNNVSLASGYHFTNGLDFPTSGLSSDPGTYLLALLYKRTNGDWELGGSSYATNPIKVILKAAAIPADPYENNNSKENPYIFYPTFVNNQYSFTTQGSSIHNEEDYDFYGIPLEAGYTYYLSGRLHDSYSSTNGQTYTNDCLVSLIVDEYTSDVYDDVLPNFQITAYSGGTAILHVSPYFEGKKGTYQLDIQVRREYGTGTDPIEVEEIFKLYPNPVTDMLNVELVKADENFSRLEIYDLLGQKVLDKNLSNHMHGEMISTDVSRLSPGNYYIRIFGKENYQKSFTKK